MGQKPAPAFMARPPHRRRLVNSERPEVASLSVHEVWLWLQKRFLTESELLWIDSEVHLAPLVILNDISIVYPDIADVPRSAGQAAQDHAAALHKEMDKDGDGQVSVEELNLGEIRHIPLQKGSRKTGNAPKD